MKDLTPQTIRTKKSNFRPERLTKSDVFGQHRVANGRLVAREGGMVVAKASETCPVFKDVVPEKAVTVVGREDDLDEVLYWLEYVKGKDCVTMTHHQDGWIALRAEHQSLSQVLHDLQTPRKRILAFAQA